MGNTGRKITVLLIAVLIVLKSCCLMKGLKYLWKHVENVLTTYGVRMLQE